MAVTRQTNTATEEDIICNLLFADVLQNLIPHSSTIVLLTINRRSCTITDNGEGPYLVRIVVLHSVLNVKALVGTFNQEKALEGASSVMVKYSRRFV